MIRDKHPSESWNWFVKSSIPRAVSPVLENFRRLSSDPTDGLWVSEDGVA